MIKNITGRQFGKLVARGYVGTNKRGDAIWECVCECGNVTKVLMYSLKGGNTRSCGCLRAEHIAANIKIHGLATTPEYKAWQSLQDRCYNRDKSSYANYGGRGITVCARWMASFENFFYDMGERPSAQHSIEREDNDGNYCPENCRWATRKEQARNRRNTRMLTYNGKSQCVAQWAEELGIPQKTLHSRLGLKWSVEKCLSTPACSRDVY